MELKMTIELYRDKDGKWDVRLGVNEGVPMGIGLGEGSEEMNRLVLGLASTIFNPLPSSFASERLLKEFLGC